MAEAIGVAQWPMEGFVMNTATIATMDAVEIKCTIPS